MKLALEIPKQHLEEFSHLTDVDFALAHLVLSDSIYAEFYAEQVKQGRRVLLDNGMHEQGGKSLTVPEIIEAAKRVNPTVVIPPDKLGDAEFTYAGFKALRTDPQNRWEPALVIQGSTHEERVRLFMDGRQYSNTLCLPYREPRSQWFKELVSATPKHVAWPGHLHLFGVNTLDELQWFSTFCERVGWPAARLCVDTAKPIKWAMKGFTLNKPPTDGLRGGGLLDHTVKLTAEQRMNAYFNIGYFRRSLT